MHLNRKGYMLVEIVVASVLAMSIAYYLLNLTYKFKNTNEDLYQSYNYMSDKILITKNIMNDLERGTVKTIDSISISSLTFKLCTINEYGVEIEKQRKLIVDKDNSIIKYGELDETGRFDTSDLSYYEKKLDSSLIIGDLSLNDVENSNSVTIKIPIKSIYSDEVYTIKLFANKQ